MTGSLVGSPDRDDPLVAALEHACAGEVRADASLAELTPLRVGGRARALVVAERDEDLAAVGRVAGERGLPTAVIGRGSNLLIADAGWPGIAIVLGRSYRGLERDGGRVRAGAAEPLPSLAVRLADAGLTGFAWAAAVPGTLGGAVRMNAGAHGGELADHLVEAELVRLGTGVREIFTLPALGLTYRHSGFPDDAVVVAAGLHLAAGDRAGVRAEIRDIRAWRRAHQPLNQPNCGSVFTNPPGGSAGALIDRVGGKQLIVGGARVSERHANFIVTRPGARAADVWTLVMMLSDRVAEQHGIRLRPEIATIGDIASEPSGEVVAP